MDRTEVRIDLARLAADSGVTVEDVARFLGMSRQSIHQSYLRASDLDDAETLKIARAIATLAFVRWHMARDGLLSIPGGEDALLDLTGDNNGWN